MSRFAVEQALTGVFEDLAICNSSLALLLRSVPHCYGDPVKFGFSEPPCAWASDRACFYGDAFADLNWGERLGVVIHEFFHVLLNHAGRAHTILKTSGIFYSKISNIASDLIINEWIIAISKRSDLQHHPRHRPVLPPFVVTAEGLAKKYPLPGPSPTAAAKNIYSWRDAAGHSTEVVYAILCELIPPGADLQIPHVSDLAEPTMSEDETVLERTKHERMVKTFAGSDPWGVASNILASMPKSQVDWRRHLRVLTARLLSDLTTRTWSRPSRRMSAYPPSVPFMPGYARAPAPIIVPIIDTSMSIAQNPTVVASFMSECRSIARQLSTSIPVIEADITVHRTTLMHAHTPDITPILDKGQGGTDFTLPLKEADKYNPNLIIYLTDLYADEPQFKPRAPVIWVANTDAAPPSFGKVIRITS